MKAKTKNKPINVALIVLSVIGMLYCLFLLYLQNGTKPVNTDDHTLIEVSINGSIKSVSKQLKEQGLIKSRLAFIAKSQLNGTAGKIKSGNYYLSKDMDNKEIIDIISIGGYEKDSVTKVRIAEGSTIDQIAETLFENKVIYDKTRFLAECNNSESIKNNPIAQYVTENNDKKYILEGFLFPDTYEFKHNSKPEEVIEKMTHRFTEVYDQELLNKTNNEGYNVDIVLTLASIVEKEGNVNDFAKVSAVLKNRMDAGMALQCDSTVRYVKNDQNTISLSHEQFNLKSPYNTYINKDLPPSPICNPSLNAIKAVLEPDKQFINDKYLYFCTKEDSSKDLIFAKTYEEHLNNVKKYIGDWKDYDEAIREN